jgi:ribosomal protein L16 Arg81 hydroxylase
MREYYFEDYVGDAESFLATYFGKRSFLRRQAFAGRLEDLRSMIDPDELLALEALPPWYLRVSKDGIGVPAKSYRRIEAREPMLSEVVVAEKVYDLFSCGATVTWNALQQVVPAVRTLIRPLAEVFGCAAEAGLFVTPAGNQGLAPHCDSMDVFVVQVYGSKTWRTWATPEFRPGTDASYSVAELGEPVLRETLRPGDMLYLPYGTPHVAIAEKDLSAHLSIGVEPRRWRHLVRDTVEAVLAADRGFHEFPLLTANPDGRTAADFEDKLLKLTELLRGVDAKDELVRLAAAGRARNATSRREFERQRGIDEFGQDTELRRRGADIRVGEREAGRARLTVGEVQVSVPEDLIAALLALDWGQTVPAGRFLPAATADRSVRAAQGLARLGLLEVAEGGCDADAS